MAMTKQQKQAMAEGREIGKIVRRYLEALEEHRPRRGRQRTPDSIKKRLAEVAAEIEVAMPHRRLLLSQERIDLEDELARMGDKKELTEAEKEFVKVGAQYSEAKGISRQAWREVGVPADVLRRAGIQ